MPREQLRFHLPAASLASGYSLRPKWSLVSVPLGKVSKDVQEGGMIRENIILSADIPARDSSSSARLSLRDQQSASANLSLGIWLSTDHTQLPISLLVSHRNYACVTMSTELNNSTQIQRKEAQ